MSTFIPAKSFTGYPDGNHKNPVRFVAGVESGPVPEEFARLMYENGLAAFVPRTAAAPTKTRRSGKSSRQSSSSQD